MEKTKIPTTNLRKYAKYANNLMKGTLQFPKALEKFK